MAEDLSDYLQQVGVRVRYMHSDIDAIERMEIIRGLRLGEFDVLVGINLLREGLDLPEVSLVAILDADQEGFLRSDRSLIQTVGRAERKDDARSDHSALFTRKLADLRRPVPADRGRHGVRRLFGPEPHHLQRFTDRGRADTRAKRDAEELTAPIHLRALHVGSSLELRQHGRKARASAEARRGASGETVEPQDHDVGHGYSSRVLLITSAKLQWRNSAARRLSIMRDRKISKYSMSGATSVSIVSSRVMSFSRRETLISDEVAA